MSAADVAQACGGVLAGVDPEGIVTSVVADSRQAEPGSLFVAIDGSRVDGHDFAAQAVTSGAVAALAGRPIPEPAILVDDPVLALGRLAAWSRRQADYRVVAVTGSSGKTTTKDLMAAVFGSIGPTVSARGSYNSEVGLPLTVLSAGADTDYLILEMGMRGLGQIAYLAGIAAPDVGVVLNVGTAHIELLGSREAIAQAKGEMVESLGPQGCAVLNADDERVAAMSGRTRAKVVTFGTAAGADVRATDVRLDEQARASFIVHHGGLSAEASLLLHGEHMVSNALAAIAAAVVSGVPLEHAAAALSAASPASSWRMEVQEAAGVTVVNDAYNANPESMAAALGALAAWSGFGRRWAVLGEMRELGPTSADQHAAIGRLAAELGIDRLVCVGEACASTARAAAAEQGWHGRAESAADAEEALRLLRDQVAPGDIVLVKASRSIGLERVALGLADNREAAR